MIQLSWELELGVFQYHFPTLSSNLTVLCVLPKLMQLLPMAGIRRSFLNDANCLKGRYVARNEIKPYLA